MPQLTVTDFSEKAVEGGLVDTGFTDKITNFSDDTVPFGYGLHEDGEGKSKLPAGAGVFRGVALHTVTVEQVAGSDLSYAPNNAIPVLRKGRVWVRAEDAVTADAQAFLRQAGGNEGQFRSDVDGGNAVAVNAWFRTSAGAGELVILEVNLP